jgi:hypothetical protein
MPVAFDAPNHAGGMDIYRVNLCRPNLQRGILAEDGVETEPRRPDAGIMVACVQAPANPVLLRMVIAKYCITLYPDCSDGGSAF